MYLGRKENMKISDALLKMDTRYKYLRRKEWKDAFIEVCNEVLYIHSDSCDVLGREWHPIRTDLIKTDWTVSQPIGKVWPQ